LFDFGEVYESAALLIGGNEASSRRHIIPNAAPAEVERPAFRTEVLLPEAPHRFGGFARASADTEGGLLAAKKVPTTADGRINGLMNPSKFGTNLFERGREARHLPIMPV